ncbi:MAG: hypothetical protein VB106_20190, partial [Clostridiaceae bacterium]|nr:hypothetical protein [Clostridiaceae bacterium]
MRKQLLFILSAFTAIIIVAFVARYIYISFFYAKSVDLSYDDNFPNIDIYNYEGAKEDFHKTNSKYTVMFYLSDHC